MTMPDNLRLIPPQGHACTLRCGARDGAFVVEVEVADGQNLPARTRTPQPVPLARAQALLGDGVAWRLGRAWRVDEPEATDSFLAGGAPPPSPADAILLARLQPNAWRLLAPAQQCRTVWRVGERGLAGAAERLVSLLGTAEPLLDYCVAWALGRLKDGGAAPALAQLVQRAGTPPVARIARLAWLECAAEDARLQWAQSVVDDWPSTVRAAWSSQDTAAMDALLATAQEPPKAESPWARLAYPVWLVQLDLVAWALRGSAQGQWARSVLQQQVRRLQLGVGTFRAWRRLFKAAELRCDGLVFGELVNLLETQRAKLEGAKQGIYLNRKYISAGKELAREDSSLAYTRATRNYFRRRSWRVLRRLARDQDPRFAGMAGGVLMACDDAANMRWCAFNHLLYAHDEGMRPSRNGLVWQRLQAPKQGQRLEAFPQLWDQHPQVLLALLTGAHASAVTGFAALALAQRDAWAQQASPLMVVRLLLHPQPRARQLAIALALKRVDALDSAWPALFDGGNGWLQLMLQAPYADVWQAALNRITLAPARYSADAGVVLAMLTAPSAGVRSHARLLLHSALAQSGMAAQLCLGLLQWLTQADPFDEGLNAFEEEGGVVETPAGGSGPVGAAGNAQAAPVGQLTERRLDTLLWALTTALRDAARQADAPAVFALLVHPLALVRAVAAHWLLLLEDAETYLPQVDIQAFLDSPLGPLRAAGVHLVGGMPQALLLQRPALIASFCTHGSKEVRAAAHPLVERLAMHTDWADSVVLQLRERLFQGTSEADVAQADAEALKQDLLSLLTGVLAVATQRTDHGAQMRLLLSKSRGAQQLGAWLLLPQAPQAFSVRECAALAGVSSAQVRQWALRAVDEGGRLAVQPQDGFALFNSRWPEARAFAQESYGQLAASAWTIPTLLLLCDHTQADAQALGRQLLTQHFDPTQIASLLPQLAQHPSMAMQTFVAQALVAHVDSLPAQDDPAQLIEQLSPYLLTVLSHVNRSRVAKDAVQQWLGRLSTRSAPAAQAVAALYGRLVVSDAQCDRTVYVQALNQLQSQYPDPASPMVQVPLPRKPERRKLPLASAAPVTSVVPVSPALPASGSAHEV